MEITTCVSSTRGLRNIDVDQLHGVCCDVVDEDSCAVIRAEGKSLNHVVKAMVLESVEDEDWGGRVFILQETAQMLNFVEADAEGQPLVPGLGVDDLRYHDQ